MKIEKYCAFCGKELIHIQSEEKYYDRHTGKKKIQVILKCPKRFGIHDKFKILKDGFGEVYTQAI